MRLALAFLSGEALCVVEGAPAAVRRRGGLLYQWRLDDPAAGLELGEKASLNRHIGVGPPKLANHAPNRTPSNTSAS